MEREERYNNQLFLSYKSNDNFRSKELDLNFILKKSKLQPNIEDWSILDLGCGSPLSTEVDVGSDDDFDAWFPRVCALKGASLVVGIDVHPQSPEDEGLYEHIEANLSDLLMGRKLIEKFGEQSFNLINTQGVILRDCPGNTFAITVGKAWSYPDRVSEKFYQIVDEVSANLLMQSSKLLKPNGILSFNENIYMLQEDGTLKTIK